MKKRYFYLSTIVIVLVSVTSQFSTTLFSTSPISIQSLRARNYESSFRLVKKIKNSRTYQSKVMSFDVDGLREYAFVITPTSEKPKGGYPTIIFGHGYISNPPTYAENGRPSGYYRDLLYSYASKGYLVIAPDYRGHKNSEGGSYTSSPVSSNYYSIDILHTLEAIQSLPQADANRIFYLGHSMGCEVGIRAALATQKIKGASLWAPTIVSPIERALFFFILYDKDYDVIEDKRTDNQTLRRAEEGYRRMLSRLPFEYKSTDGQPWYFLDELEIPVIIHHAEGDRYVPYEWSQRLISKLYSHHKPFRMYSYDSDRHLLTGTDRYKAIERDISFFESL